jgi:N-glycosylase/DNA lyase
VVGNSVIRICQNGKKLVFEGTSTKFIREYFSLDMDLVPVLASIDRDPFIHAAIRSCKGLRLIRQPKWECLVSYICSTNSNIPAIRKRIAHLAEQFGDPIKTGDGIYYSFPEPSAISCKGINALEGCKLGYRSPYVFRTSCRIDDRESWESAIDSMPYEEARRDLMQCAGVGPKAADCILLFAFQKYEAFPVDVWIRRIMQQQYLPELSTGSPLTGREYDVIRRFARVHFGEYCGYAQEFLYGARES